MLTRALVTWQNMQQYYAQYYQYYVSKMRENSNACRGGEGTGSNRTVLACFLYNKEF
jgi:hypothetical protein